MYPDPEELPGGDPGLDHLLRALTSEGDATELLGRQAALTMFRTARAQAGTQAATQAATQGLPALGFPTQGFPAQDSGPAPERRPRASRRTGPRTRRFPLAAGISTAVAAAFAGMAVAAYAAVLPSPVQNIAHKVFAPIGVPAASPAAPGSVTPGVSGGPGQGGSTSPNGPGPSPANTPTASATSPPGVPGVSVTMTAARSAVPFGGADGFTGRMTRDGKPARLVRVRLLMRPAGGGTWRLVTTGLTNANGVVRLAGPLMAADASFELAGTGKLASATSAPLTVTVIPRIAVRVSATDVLTVTVWPASAGDQALLQELRGGAWQPVATLQLVAHKAAYQVRPGGTYRVAVPATAEHDAALSAPAFAPISTAVTPAGASPAARTTQATRPGPARTSL
jgi:hypothetical protein